MATKFVNPLLEGGHVTIEVLPKRKGGVILDKDEDTIMSGVIWRVVLQQELNGLSAGGLKNPFLEYYKFKKESDKDARSMAKELQSLLEDELQLNSGSLSPIMPSGQDLREGKGRKCIWLDPSYSIEFSKNGKSIASAAVTLDLSKPLDFCKYCIAIASSEVANDWKSRNSNPAFKYAIRNEFVDIKDEIAVGVKQAETTKALLDMMQKEDVDGLFTVYQYFMNSNSRTDYKETENVTKSWGHQKLFLHLQYLNTIPKVTAKLYEACQMSIEELDLWGVFFKAEAEGIIKKVNSVYSHLKEGVDIGSTPEEVVEWLRSPERRVIKQAIKKVK